MKLTGIVPGLVVDPSSYIGRKQLPYELSPCTGAGVTQNQEAAG